MTRISPAPELSSDVVVLGGGLSGSATALELARLGATVTVLERAHQTVTRIGEVLRPEARVWLDRLGLWNRFADDRHLAVWGHSSAWGSPIIRRFPFLLSPYGMGWHIDRSRFDAMLVLAAEEAGAVILRGTRVVAVDPPTGGDAWRLAIAGELGRLRLRAQ